jgi:hypothetical protein
LAVIVARVVAFAWSLGVVIFALHVRSNAGEAGDSSIEHLGRLGLIVAALIALTGWVWSDRVTRNVHRLGGRLPTRLRCVSAWALPLAWAALLWLTVLRIDPTEVFDVRPMIIVAVMAAAVWRPYALVRRIVATLTRIRSDALIGTGYVFDLSAFGLLWWQLARWPSNASSVDAGQADVLLGVSAAAAVGLGFSVAVWTLLALDVEQAEGDRLLALRTRHDHRHLRLRGINPMDPEVRWALLRIRQEEELERRAAEEHGHVPRMPAPAPAAQPREVVAEEGSIAIDPVEVAPPFQSPEIEPVRPEEGLPTSAHEAAPAAEPAPAADEASEAVAPPLSEILDSDAGEQIIAELVDEIATAETSAQILAELVEEVAAEQPPEIAVEPVGLTPAPDEETGQQAEAEPQADAEEPRTDLAARLRARLSAGPTPRLAARSHPTIEPVEEQAPVSRLARRLDMAGAGSREQQREPSVSRIAAASAPAAAEAEISSRRDRFAQRLGDSGDAARSQRSLLERLEEYGITPNVSGGEPVPSLADEFRQEEERWIPPRLYELEAVRYLLLVGIVVVAVTSAWIVTRTVSVGGDLVGGQIAPEDLDRINVARRSFVTALSVTLTLVVLWSAVFVSHARRAGAPQTREWLTYSLLAVTIALNVVSFVADGDTRATLSLACLTACVIAALAAVALLAPIAGWFERRTVGLTVWTTGLAFVMVISWLGGLQQPIEPTDALEALTFVAALQAIAAAVVVVIAALSTSDLEDAIRLSPTLAGSPAASHVAPVG